MPRSPYTRSDRCVNCGMPLAGHTTEGVCPFGKSHFATMNLPEGKTCGDCVHLARPCAPIYDRIAADEVCDWYPMRFLEKKAP